MSNVVSKKRRVLNYLAAGRGITAAEARSRFGVKNIRAMMSDIRTLVERYGNWEIETEETRSGGTRYFMRNSGGSKRKFCVDSMETAVASSR